MSSASTLDQTKKGVFCYCCNCKEKSFRWRRMTPCLTTSLSLSCTAWVHWTAGNEGDSQKMRVIWSGFRKSRNLSLALGRLIHSALSKSQRSPQYNTLGILPLKSFPAPGGQEERSSSPTLWILSSQWNTARQMQCRHGGKIAQMLGKELNAPSFLPGPTEERWAGAANVVTQSFQIHRWTRDFPTHKQTFLLFVQLRLLCKQTRCFSPQDCCGSCTGDSLETWTTGLRKKDFKKLQQQIPAEPIKQFILGQIKCVSCSCCTQIF